MWGLSRGLLWPIATHTNVVTSPIACARGDVSWGGARNNGRGGGLWGGQKKEEGGRAHMPANFSFVRTGTFDCKSGNNCRPITTAITLRAGRGGRRGVRARTGTIRAEKYRANEQSQQRAVACLAEDADGFTPDAGIAG
jgi:hypothetical protein